MLSPTYPGVYTQEQSSGVRPIAGAPTSVALFVGPTRSGIDNRSIRCLNYGDFERQFGGIFATSSLSYSVLHFFANGGGEAFVMRVPVAGAVAAKFTVKRDVDAGGDSIHLAALSSGAASNSIFIEVDPFEIDAHPYQADHDKKRFNLTIGDAITGRVERFRDLTTAAGNARAADRVVNDPTTGSKLVSLKILGSDLEGPKATGTIYSLGTMPTSGTFTADVKVTLTVTSPPAGSRSASAKTTASAKAIVVSLEVTAFTSGSAKPTSPLEFLTRLVAAANDALRRSEADAVKKLDGALIEGAIFEGGRLMRLRLTPPPGAIGPERIHDAVVDIAEPSSPTTLATEFGFRTTGVTNPSRYLLGQAYPLVTDPAAGVDGESHGQPASDAFRAAISGLETPDPFFNLLCLPDLVRPKPGDPSTPQHTGAAAMYAEAARICAKKFAFLLVDPPPDTVDVGSAEAWKSIKLGFSASHAGAWFPNIRVDDPKVPDAIISHPPSGAIAGVIARTDAQVGVWQAPAGTGATLVGVYGPAVELSDEEHGLLNPIGLNVIRRFPIYQTVAFGSRTVDGANVLGSEWKYIPVRRTADYILRSLSESLRWAVHKPNGEELWSQLRVSCTAFMHGLFRQGAFKGTSARTAYVVACDASTTPQEDIDLGIVNVVVGFAPLKPAEFVVITLRQIVQPAA